MYGMKTEATITTDRGTAKLVDAPTLLEVLWDERCRPSLRSLRTWTTNRVIPCVRVGGLVYYDPDAVRAALARRTVNTRT